MKIKVLIDGDTTGILDDETLDSPADFFIGQMVSVTVEDENEDGKKSFCFPKVYHLFHRSQVEAIGCDNGGAE